MKPVLLKQIASSPLIRGISTSLTSRRIDDHPIVKETSDATIPFTFNGTELYAREGETIASALVANGIDAFSFHSKDGSPMGLFCASGQCGQCSVFVDKGLGVVKSCVTPVTPNMEVQSLKPHSDAENKKFVESKKGELESSAFATTKTLSDYKDVAVKEVDVLIIGAGPAGISACFSLNKAGVKNILMVDDKDKVGGKLVLQTHTFFGSKDETNAGVRGFEIANILSDRLEKECKDTVTVWNETNAVGAFEDGYIGVNRRLRNPDGSIREEYSLIKPKRVLVATGAMERTLAFPGNTLPGVYGAGALQTLVNRDLVKMAKNVLIVGGGNVGLVAGFHCLQAGINVKAVIEGGPKTIGYKVHRDKLERCGVPIHCRHTILEAKPNADGTRVGSVVTAKLDDKWTPIPGTEKEWKDIDAVLVAVGLTPVNDLYFKCKHYGIPAWRAGDAGHIAEASHAMFMGKVVGRDIAVDILSENAGIQYDPESHDRFSVLPEGMRDIDEDSEKVLADMLCSHPGKTITRPPVTLRANAITPVLHCVQEIPCDSCHAYCPTGVLNLVEDRITGTPVIDDKKKCIGCGACVGRCPGMAITLADTRTKICGPDKDAVMITFPCELPGLNPMLEKAKEHRKQKPFERNCGYVRLVSRDSEDMGIHIVRDVKIVKGDKNRRMLVSVLLKMPEAQYAVGCVPVSEEEGRKALAKEAEMTKEMLSKIEREKKTVICRCERVSLHETRSAIRHYLDRVLRNEKASGIPAPRNERGQIYVDLASIKADTRLGMGTCGGKSCGQLINRVLAEEGGAPFFFEKRPLSVETPVAALASTIKNIKFIPEKDVPIDVEEEKRGNFDRKTHMYTHHVPTSKLVSSAPATLVPSVFKSRPLPTSCECDHLYTDVVVAGAGSAGIAFAKSIAEKNMKATDSEKVNVMVLEARPNGGQGSQKHAIGGVRQALSNPDKVLLVSDMLKDLKSWKADKPEFESESEADIEWFTTGYVFPAYNEECDHLYTDVVVAGAGSAGIAFAKSIDEKNMKATDSEKVNVMVLEARPNGGQGSQKHAIGGVRQALSNPDKVLLVSDMLKDLKSWKADKPEFESESEADIEWFTTGYVFPAYNDEVEGLLKGIIATQSKNAGKGLHPETGLCWINAKEVLKLCPWASAKNLKGAAYSPTDGICSPLRWATSAIRRATYDPEETGVSLSSGIRVLKIENDSETGESLVWCEHVHPTTGEVDTTKRPIVIHSKKVIESLGGAVNLVLDTSDLPMLPLLPDSHEACITAPNPDFNRKYIDSDSKEYIKAYPSPMFVDIRHGGVDGTTKNFYFYMNELGQVIMCSTPTPAVQGLDCSSTSRFLPEMCARTMEVFPDVAHSLVRRVWRGIYTNSVDGLPLLGWNKENNNIFHLNGLCGHGFMLSGGVGKLAADEVWLKLNGKDESPFFKDDVRARILTNLAVGREMGIYTNSVDGLPLLGWNKENNNIFHLNGLCGHGFMLSGGVGKLAADEVWLKLNGKDESPFFKDDVRARILTNLAVGREMGEGEKLH
ncbi:hypothetical protein ADUPG1_012238 [Aduncisulcus paluster]|uniref:Sarcosine oxidase n=1 Tax=Aduncisulcus paluster TaxID=2918883 RepID=A0ABQ5JYS7_9EUKA|nr:hypothetical protein ADUPG1_012238 [Aduncisulcus paluster]